jgi:hypothetical protein
MKNSRENRERDAWETVGWGPGRTVTKCNECTVTHGTTPGNYDMATTYSGDFLEMLTLCLLRGGPSAEAQSAGTTSPPSDADCILPEGPSTPEMTS